MNSKVEADERLLRRQSAERKAFECQRREKRSGIHDQDNRYAFDVQTSEIRHAMRDDHKSERNNLLKNSKKCKLTSISTSVHV